MPHDLAGGLSETAPHRAYHCEECRRAFSWALLQDHWHWSKAISADAPTFCPCCGSYACIQPGMDATALNCAPQPVKRLPFFLLSQGGAA